MERAKGRGRPHRGREARKATAGECGTGADTFCAQAPAGAWFIQLWPRRCGGRCARRAFHTVSARRGAWGVRDISRQKLFAMR